MMDLLKIGAYTPPSPSKYKVDYNDVNGAEEQTESGANYIEQVVAQVPTISVGWTNMKEADVTTFLEAVKPAQFDCTYFFGSERTFTAQCKNPSIEYKLIKDDVRYYDVSAKLEG